MARIQKQAWLIKSLSPLQVLSSDICCTWKFYCVLFFCDLQNQIFYMGENFIVQHLNVITNFEIGNLLGVNLVNIL